MKGSATAVVRGRHLALKRCFENLIGNAVKYGMNPSVLVSMDEAHAMVTVQDEGPGIPDADKERVFEPFLRLEMSRNNETGASALG